jgi:hypothetical protein
LDRALAESECVGNGPKEVLVTSAERDEGNRRGDTGVVLVVAKVAGWDFIRRARARESRWPGSPRRGGRNHRPLFGRRRGVVD